MQQADTAPMPRSTTAFRSAVLVAAALLLVGCASTPSVTPAPDSSRNYAQSDTTWNPGNYLQKYTRSLPETQFEPPVEIVNARDWDPGNYLEKYTRSLPETRFESPAQIINARDWNPGHYLERYTR